jgi:Tfp pilus assembly protein PilN
MISINFASGNYRLIDRVWKGMAAFSLILTAAALIIIGSAVFLRSQIKSVDRNLNELAAAEEQYRPLLVERELITKNLSAMTGLLESRRFSWTRMLTGVEQVVPVGVALSKLSYHARDRAVVLEGGARTPESLRSLMVGLEHATMFHEPYLKHQSMDKGSISFNVVTSYRKFETAGMAPGK